jgi:membrane protein required for colicin V production
MDIGWVDIALLGVLLLSVLLGIMRGFVFELLAIAGWVVAFFVAQWATPVWAAAVPVGTPGSAVNHLATFALLFVAALFVWSLLAWLVKRLIRASALSAIDRVLGALFGLARGVLVVLAAAVMVLWTPLARSAAWQASHGAAVLESMISGLKPLMPAELADRLPG